MKYMGMAIDWRYSLQLFRISDVCAMQGLCHARFVPCAGRLRANTTGRRLTIPPYLYFFSGKPVGAVGAEEEIADGPVPAQREPAAALMLSLVVKHVAALTERLQVPRPVVRGIVVQVRGGQHHSCRIDRQVRRPGVSSR